MIKTLITLVDDNDNQNNLFAEIQIHFNKFLNGYR